MVAAGVDKKRALALVELLRKLAEAHDELLEIVERKIAAMRTADTQRLTDIMRTEHTVIARIQEHEGLRRQLTENIARSYGISPAVARRLSAEQLAAKLGPEAATRIDVQTRRLRGLVGAIAKRNHVAQRISQGILRHMKHVFAAMTGEGSQRAVYAGDGEISVGAGETIFDTVG